jgi:TolA-binding protein
MKIARVATGLTLALVLAGLARGSSAAAPDGAAADRSWKEKLGLSADQDRKLVAALESKDTDLQPRRDELRGAMRRLQTQVTENAAEKDVEATLQRLARLRRLIALREDQFDAETASFLTPSQSAKLLVWRTLNACRDRSVESAADDDLQESASAEEVEPE